MKSLPKLCHPNARSKFGGKDHLFTWSQGTILSFVFCPARTGGLRYFTFKCFHISTLYQLVDNLAVDKSSVCRVLNHEFVNGNTIPRQPRSTLDKFQLFWHQVLWYLVISWYCVTTWKRCSPCVGLQGQFLGGRAAFPQTKPLQKPFCQRLVRFKPSKSTKRTWNRCAREAYGRELLTWNNPTGISGFGLNAIRMFDLQVSIDDSGDNSKATFRESQRHH